MWRYNVEDPQNRKVFTHFFLALNGVRTKLIKDNIFVNINYKIAYMEGSLWHAQ